MRTIEWITGAALLLAVSGPGHAQAAHIWYDEADGIGIVNIEGTIDNYDTRQYLSIEAELKRRNKNIAVVSLDSPGGDQIEAETLAKFGIAGGPVTMVASGRTCASACVLLLMAGKTRMVFAGARVGVHSAVEAGGGEETMKALGFTTDSARMLADRGMALDVIGRLVTTPPGSMYWLSADDLLRSGVKIGPDMRKLGRLPPSGG